MGNLSRFFNKLPSKPLRKSFLAGAKSPRAAGRPRSHTLGLEELESRMVPTTALLPGGQLLPPPISMLPGSPAWFQSHLIDPGIRSLAQSDFTSHGSLTRADMLGIFAEVESEGPLTSAELQDLRFLVANSAVLNMTDEVRFETSEVVNTNGNTYQNSFVGGLQVGSPVSLQIELVDKWFLGMDHPVASGAYGDVSGNLFVSGAPSYLNVHQGNLGDCWLLASLAEVAAREPGVIENMITFDGQSTEFATTPYSHIPYAQTVDIWSIRFFNNAGNASYITVDSELPSGGTYYAQPNVSGVLGNGALWVALVEKAYVQANGDGFVTSGNPYDNGYADLNDGSPEWAMSALVGPSANFSIDPNNAAAAWTQGSLVVMCTGSSTFSYDLVPSHCYAMVAYNAGAPLPFQLYNPWGTNASNWAPYTYNGFYVYGLFTANAAFLTQNFGVVTQTGSPAEAWKWTVTQAPVPSTVSANSLSGFQTASPEIGAFTGPRDGMRFSTASLREPCDILFADWSNSDAMSFAW